MKKLSVLLLAAAMVLAFTMPAAAIDNIFGGYWRTRAFTNQNFTGEDVTEAQDVTKVDSRTRLYYTAKFTDDLQFVNKFEFDWQWGTGPQGDIGADGQVFEIKNSYADFNVLNKALNFKIGMQGYRWGRGFMFDDDFSGAVVTYKGAGFDVPFVWVKDYEGGAGLDANDSDVDYYTLNPSFTFGGFKINPFFTYVMSEDGAAAAAAGASPNKVLADVYEDINLWYLGANVDFKVSGFNVWGTAIYNGGDADISGTTTSSDYSGYLFGLGASGAMGPFGIHGEFWYSSGDDDAADEDQEAFIPPRGASYYWAEIMGFGIFDDRVSANSPGDQITNIWAGNIGADYKLLPSLKTTLDLWYAERVEPTSASPDEDLGFEVDLKATYQVMPNLNLDLVGAYLFAGDGTALGGATNDEDPYELGARLSLSF
ncbi:MAG: hypothetical protein C4530_03495 [Desulfobacteraceae bacterium]|nr:MAG: hypothetical protein C4530_03495 [Desulfobacteraceae bacterium]